jgi:hypothetical protein
VLFDESTVGMRKVDAVRIAVERINADVTVRTVDAWFDAAGARDMVAGYDLIVDASDNYNVTVNAQYNWWGNATGPYHPTNYPSGTGDNVTDWVDCANHLGAAVPKTVNAICARWNGRPR